MGLSDSGTEELNNSVFGVGKKKFLEPITSFIPSMFPIMP